MSSTIIRGVKWLGEKTYQAGRFVVTEVIPSVVENAANIVLNSDKATDEQKERAKRNLARYGKDKK